MATKIKSKFVNLQAENGEFESFLMVARIFALHIKDSVYTMMTTRGSYYGEMIIVFGASNKKEAKKLASKKYIKYMMNEVEKEQAINSLKNTCHASLF